MSTRARYVLWPHTGFVLAVGRVGVAPGWRMTIARVACARVRRARGLRLAKIYTDNSASTRRYRRGPRAAAAASQGALGSTAVHAHAPAPIDSGNRICFRQRRPSERWSLKLVSPLLFLLALRPLVRVGRGRTTFNTCESLGHFFQLVLVGLMLLPNALERVIGRGQLL